MAADVEIAVKKVVQEINAAALSRGDRGLNILRNASLEVLGHDGSGRRYRNGHVASAPGEAPAPEFGNLRDKWRPQKLAQSSGGGVRIIMRIKSKMPYAKYLDPGTRYIAQRPYIKPIKDKARPQIAALFANI